MEGAVFFGREQELNELNRLYDQVGFQMVVLYGRRRVGKTTLALEFARDKSSLIFTAKVQNDALNLADFSRALYSKFGLPVSMGSFSSWDAAFEFFAKMAGDKKVVFVFDEFPYAASKNSALVSTLQIAIDRTFKNTNIFLVLTGSNQGFMEEKVLGAMPAAEGELGLGEKNPLFGRRTAQIRLAPFGYLDAAKMLPGKTPIELATYYACFGGTPYYLSLIDQHASFEENVTRLFFRKEGLLYEGPMMLLRQELREPATYNSILGAIAAGANTPTAISDKTGIERTSVAKYLNTLVSLRLVEKVAPFGENPKTTRRGIYRITEPCYSYWYGFVEPAIAEIEQNAGELVAADVLQPEILSTHVGHWFKAMCKEWLIAQAKKGELPIRPTWFGSWWGTNPETRQQDDIDVIAANPRRKELLLGECKWRESFNETKAIEKLHSRARVFKDYDHACLALFTKHGVGEATKEKCARQGCIFVAAADLYE